MRKMAFLPLILISWMPCTNHLGSSTPGHQLLRIPLDFLQGEKFLVAAENYIRPLLTKGVPSLFSDLSPLYDHPGKADILEKLILELEHSLRISGGYPGRTEKEPPSTLMWTLFFLAQHYDRRGQY
ncbi:N-TERMINAL ACETYLTRANSFERASE-RELATED, partial [Salix koriyanagi]